MIKKRRQSVTTQRREFMVSGKDTLVSVIRLPVQYTTHETQPRVTIFVNERRHSCTPVAKALSVPLSTASPHEGTSAQN